jgi:hypothetical protein
MDSVFNFLSVIFPIIVLIVYFLAAFYLIKVVIYVLRLPKQLRAMEKRIEQLEEERKK